MLSLFSIAMLPDDCTFWNKVLFSTFFVKGVACFHCSPMVIICSFLGLILSPESVAHGFLPLAIGWRHWPSYLPLPG